MKAWRWTQDDLKEELKIFEGWNCYRNSSIEVKKFNWRKTHWVSKVHIGSFVSTIYWNHTMTIMWRNRLVNELKSLTIHWHFCRFVIEIRFLITKDISCRCESWEFSMWKSIINKMKKRINLQTAKFNFIPNSIEEFNLQKEFTFDLKVDSETRKIGMEDESAFRSSSRTNFLNLCNVYLTWRIFWFTQTQICVIYKGCYTFQ